MSEAQPFDPDWDLADRLAKALRLADVAPGEMAEHLGVHRNTVGNYLHGRGQRGPSRAVLRVWALRCGVPYEWLVSGSTLGTDGSDWTDVWADQLHLFAA